ncbi:formate dehydrogenase accessory sulfurtransferase FdhD [Priestia megaterium]|jgi:FdhD protein|uniref:Sulfur carrier protein FdhD n=3 Tax=Bacillaceae TaxID=186817 RepID=A0A2B2YND9_PRIMG|nr:MULTISPECIES: formate dehydrogenase accessory sulfurtransferase FdhD [Priestia]MEB2276697.1 formate dehydrogenase accessory sulfurtransferase FdhD [Bacillus sp. ILBB4]TCN09027.1 FdhD protein [Bacillus sp. BK006]AJI25161.1 formate dehydrogenase family accessory protein FdhD [Priestia megaterium NBRC 15308 = ATCC 14581]AYE48725.1 formate dehydrogenase accessory sulfurtransferase FdhD [Priestia megaterium NCT-2]KFN06797.1 formate dehydrogenase family accessory protein FdhD [Priestia megaterium
MNSTVKKRTVLRFKNGQMESVEDKIVTEFPVTVKINEEEFVTMVCSPQYIEDMVIGYLASEGVIRAYTDIKNIWVQEKEGYVHVTIDKLNPYFQNLQNKRYITSCCGASRQGFVFINDALTAKKMNDISVELSIKDCFQLMNKLQQSAATFQETGGVHNAAICDKNGFMLSRMDIGRHNALDKLYGYCLKHHISIRDKVVVFSGRISSEILLKVAKIGCEVVLSKSAPTELALNLAEELGITTVGFIRNDSLNIYTCPERILRES